MIIATILVFFMSWMNRILLFVKGFIWTIVSGYTKLMDFIDYALPPRFLFLFPFFVLLLPGFTSSSELAVSGGDCFNRYIGSRPTL